MRRLALLVLAALPTLWGTCVTWFAASRTEPAVAQACPCCVQEDPVVPKAPAKAPCDGCGFREASRGVLPAQAVPPLPAATLLADLVPDVVVGPVVAFAHAARAPEALGPPPDLLSSVVLLI
jgi:hypothetical protein